MVAERLAVATNNPAGRPSNAVLQGRLARAREVNGLIRAENRALRAELATAGHEMTALGARIDLSIRADRPDVALHVSGRLFSLGRALVRRGEGSV